VDVNGVYKLTRAGETFINSIDNQVRRDIDAAEGLIQLLFQASSLGKGKRSDFLKDWKEYLLANSNIKEESVVKDFLRRRMVNLLGRKYVDRDGNAYSINSAGQQYLDTVNKNNLNDNLSHLTTIGREIEKYNKDQRELLRQYLEKTTPT
jgi:restriction system protein